MYGPTETRRRMAQRDLLAAVAVAPGPRGRPGGGCVEDGAVRSARGWSRDRLGTAVGGLVGPASSRASGLPEETEAIE